MLIAARPPTPHPTHPHTPRIRLQVCNHPMLSYPPQSYAVGEAIVRTCGKLVTLDRMLIKLRAAGHRCAARAVLHHVPSHVHFRCTGREEGRGVGLAVERIRLEPQATFGGGIVADNTQLRCTCMPLGIFQLWILLQPTHPRTQTLLRPTHPPTLPRPAHTTSCRVLLFSTMTRLLDLLEVYLQWRTVPGTDTPGQRLKYLRIDGSTSLEARCLAFEIL